MILLSYYKNVFILLLKDSTKALVKYICGWNLIYIE